MSDTLDWRDIAHITGRRWWIPVVLAVLGALLGVYAATSLAPVHRSQGTVLVGPLDSTVTRSTTLRASESLATFYADLARRELVLVPVRERLGLEMPLEQLRTSVSATVPDENRRVVVVTVESGSEEEARSIASEIVTELVSLSPAPTGATAPEFVGAQVDALETTIQRLRGPDRGDAGHAVPDHRRARACRARAHRSRSGRSCSTSSDRPTSSWCRWSRTRTPAGWRCWTTSPASPTPDAPRRAPAPWSVQRQARSSDSCWCGCWTGESAPGTSCRKDRKRRSRPRRRRRRSTWSSGRAPASRTAGCHAPHPAGPSLARSRGASVRASG